MSEDRAILVEGDGCVYLIKVRDSSGDVCELWPVRDILPFDGELDKYVFNSDRGRFYIDPDDVEVIDLNRERLRYLDKPQEKVP